MTRRPAAAALHSSQEGAKPAEARARVAERSRTWWKIFAVNNYLKSYFANLTGRTW